MLIVAIAPLVTISLYSHPCADDYTYGLLTHKAWSSSHSFIEVIKQAFLQVKSSYHTWQGTHTSVFLMALSPAVFEVSVSYGASAWIMIFMLLISVFSICDAVFVHVFGAKKWMSFLFSMLLQEERIFRKKDGYRLFRFWFLSDSMPY